MEPVQRRAHRLVSTRSPFGVSMFRYAGSAALVSIALVVASRSACAQCLDWHAFPSSGSELVGDVVDTQVFDDGSGPALYLAGDLSLPDVSVTHFGVVRWNGTAF